MQWFSWSDLFNFDSDFAKKTNPQNGTRHPFNKQASYHLPDLASGWAVTLSFTQPNFPAQSTAPIGFPLIPSIASNSKRSLSCP